ncbi:MAG: hypothetical protein R2862_01035 [Thermoanaerobaculia bacterium]
MRLDVAVLPDLDALTSPDEHEIPNPDEVVELDHMRVGDLCQGHEAQPLSCSLQQQLDVLTHHLGTWYVVAVH